jgi:hypothetical protein
MGAATFGEVGEGADAETVFRALVKSAAYEHGHGGYTGTIAEKTKMRMVTPPAGITDEKAIIRWADSLLKGETDEDGEGTGEFGWVQDKWGPAACVELPAAPTPKLTAARKKAGKPAPATRRFYFFGWASE